MQRQPLPPAVPDNPIARWPDFPDTVARFAVSHRAHSAGDPFFPFSAHNLHIILSFFNVERCFFGYTLLLFGQGEMARFLPSPSIDPAPGFCACPVLAAGDSSCRSCCGMKNKKERREKKVAAVQSRRCIQWQACTNFVARPTSYVTGLRLCARRAHSGTAPWLHDLRVPGFRAFEPAQRRSLRCTGSLRMQACLRMAPSARSWWYLFCQPLGGLGSLPPSPQLRGSPCFGSAAAWLAPVIGVMPSCCTISCTTWLAVSVPR